MDAYGPVPDRLLPPKTRSRSVGAITRAVVTLIALAVLGAVAYRAYVWFTDDMARRETAASEEPGGIAVPPPVEVQDTAPSANVPNTAPNGVAAAMNPDAINDPDQRRAMCAYLAAESERLNHEFKQPLPPPVIDRIATEIAQLQAQTNRYGCASATD